MADPKPDKQQQKDDDGLRRDDQGNLIDPPVLPEYEQRINLAAASGDTLLLADVQKEYNDARVKEARAQADRERRREEAAERRRQEAAA